VAGEATAVSWRERLWPSWWLAPAVLFVGTGFGLVVAPFGGVAMVVVGLLATAAVAAMLLATTATVAVEDGMLVAGRARIPLALVGEPEVLDADAMRHARGPGLDARAYLCLRGWIPGGVRVPLLDPQDPAPYWLVSSRRPGELAEAVRRGRP
jgi:hypothetical protein